MVAGVGPTDCWRVLPGLPGRREGVQAGAVSGAGRQPAHCLEVQPQLAHVIRHLVAGEISYNK